MTGGPLLPSFYFTMSYVPANVKKLMKENNQIAAAAEHSHSLRVGNITAGWHEKDFKRQSANLNTSRMSGPRSISSNPTVAHETGAHTGLQVAKLARQERLKELYAEEARAYEQELQAMGLALLKPRD